MKEKFKWMARNPENINFIVRCSVTNKIHIFIVVFLSFPKSTDNWSKQNTIMSAPPKALTVGGSQHGTLELAPNLVLRSRCQNRTFVHLLLRLWSPVGCMTHVWRSTWSGCCPAGPVSCPTPPGSLPACGFERCWSVPSPPQTSAHQPTLLWKSGNYPPQGKALFWILEMTAFCRNYSWNIC